MQEEIEQRTIALSIKTAKLSGKVLTKAFGAAIRKIQKEHQKGLTPHGKQSVKKLMGHGASVSSLPIDGETRLWDSVARKYNVDYAFHKTGQDKYLLFFKAGQADAITAAFSDYTKLTIKRAKDKRPPIRSQLKRFAELVKTRPLERERKREAVRDDR